jgi:hypothetical protein
MKDHESGEFFFTWTFASLIGSVADLVIGQTVTDLFWPHPVHALLGDNEIFFRLVILGLSICSFPALWNGLFFAVTSPFPAGGGY